MYDTIIIGAGMSGLAAGIRLAYYDQRVCILERHTTIGGLNSFYRLGGRDYDVGLHALTNITPRGTRKGPLARLLRQLRFSWDDFSIAPQVGSTIAFPDVRLAFGNDIDLLESEIAAKFPRQKDNFQKVLGLIVDYDDLDRLDTDQSAREVLATVIDDPLLVEMLLCPLLYYGSAREDDIDFYQFCIMFRAIYLEGLGRPLAGVRLILKNLVRKFRSLGGELKLKAGVERLHIADDRVAEVRLENGEQLAGTNVLSSAGWVETMRLCDDGRKVERPAGRLSFCETISTLDVQPRDLGHDRTIVFFNDSPRFVWRRPEELCDVRSGVICSPNNFRYNEDLAEGTIRVTTLANFDRWSELDPEQYQLEKLRWYERIVAASVRYMPDYRGHVVQTDMFTPKTIVRFTGHENGAVYGAPRKQRDGTTHLKNLYVCGTDQGLVGIIGSILSGIAIANRHLLERV